MKQLILISLFSMFFSTTFCQQDPVLKNFEFRNSNYRAINFNIGASGAYQKKGVTSGHPVNTTANGLLDVTYYNLKSTDRILFTASAGLATGFSAATSKDAVLANNTRNIYRTKNYSLVPQWTVLNKWFNKKKFIELGIDGYAMLSGNKTTVNPIPTGNSKDNQSGYSAAVNTGIGKGRLENITDMQNALWLAKTLQGVNRLRHRLTPEELDALGHTITTANNTRVLDARRRTQFILRTVDHYFQENHLIDTTDITYFSNLNDIVFFAFNTPRLSGTEKFIRFTPGMTGYDDKAWQNNYSDKRKEASTVRSLDLSIGISKYVPLSLKTQNNFGTALHFDYANINYANHYYTSGILTNETKDNADLRQAALNVFFEHAIYPNTRTQILFKLQSLGGYQELNKQTDWFVTANATAGWNYFISYSTRLQINLGGIYSKNAYEVDRYVSQLPDNIQLYGSVVLNIAI